MELSKNKIYKREHWDDNIAFTWCDQFECFAYIDVEATKEEGKIVFQDAYYEENIGFYSLVSDKVLNANNIIEVNLKEKEDKMDKNYIGKYEAVIKCSDGRFYKVDSITKDKLYIGSLVVVENFELEIYNVIEIIPNIISNANKINKAKAWVVDVIDDSRQKLRKDATIKRKYIIKQLEEKRKALEAKEMYKALASKDIEAEKLLKELEIVENV